MEINQALALYQKFSGSNTTDGIVKYFNLPSCDYSTRIAHKIWAKLMSIHSYTKGVEHLNKNKYPALANLDLKTLQVMIEELKKVDLHAIHKQLSHLDKIFDNTH